MTLTIADYEYLIEGHKRLVRELDVALNGDGAAKQASLCDIVGQVQDWHRAGHINLVRAAMMANEGLHADWYGWTFGRGRVTEKERLWTFEVVRLVDGLLVSDDPPLAMTENDDPLQCVIDAIYEISNMDAWVASPALRHSAFYGERSLPIFRLRFPSSAP